MGNVTSKLIEAYAEVNEKKKLDPVGQADADIDNDGDVDKSDKYLHNRRKAVKKAMKDDEMKEAYESYGENVIKATKMYMKDNSCTYEMAAEKYGCSAEQVKKCASEMYKKEEVEESTKSALAKKLAKASAPSEKGKKAVTLKKAPWDKDKKSTNEEEVVMNPKKEKKGSDEMANEEVVNELSKATLGSYAKKAVSDIDQQKKKAAGYDKAANRSNNFKTITKNINKASSADHRADNRKKGIVKAVDKLTREEVELPTIYSRILEARKKPEGEKAGETAAKGEMDFVKTHTDNIKVNDDDKKGHEDASKAGRVGPSAKARPADNMKGDKKVIPSATPMKGK